MSGQGPDLAGEATRVNADIGALAELTEAEWPYTRRAFSPLFERGRRWLAERFREAGLAVRLDAGGNMIGRRPGTGATGRTLMLGSHSDTVPAGGRFDGVAGVVAALEAARRLDEAGVALSHDLEIVDFLAEEVSPFGVSCLGSRAMAGQVPASWLDRRDETGRSQAEALRQVGGDPDRLAAAERADIAGFAELHIEQGRVLEEAGCQLGVVTDLVGITRFEMTLSGQADHAGTTPMGQRRDALAAAARLIQGVEEAAQARVQAGESFVATVGELHNRPNAANIVPGEVRLIVDARSRDRAVMDGFRTALAELAERIGAQTGVAVTGPTAISDKPAVPCDRRVMDALAAGAERSGAAWQYLVSGAGHDTAWLAGIAPAAMVFTPCLHGRSHSPEEWAEARDIAAGAGVLAEAACRLDGQAAPPSQDA